MRELWVRELCVCERAVGESKLRVRVSCVCEQVV